VVEAVAVEAAVVGPALARGSAPVIAAADVAAAVAASRASLSSLGADLPLATATSPARVVVFDVETTGTDRRRDQVIELCVQLGLDDEAPSRTWRIKPSVAISPGAQAVHGISMDDLAGCPSFADCADDIVDIFRGVDVVIGYNLAFDIDMVQAEMERLGRPPIDFHGKTIVDPFRLWQQCEPRSLQHAHQRFVGNGFAAAHSASADVAATGRVLQGMLRSFGLADRDWTAIATVCDPQRSSWVGPSRHLQWDTAGATIVFGFGKHQGTPVHALAASDAGYLRWLLNKDDFPSHVLDICRRALELPGDELHSWARHRYGQAAPTAQPPFADQASASSAAASASSASTSAS
jgi:DNA polymerase-3 subunit epsilon